MKSVKTIFLFLLPILTPLSTGWPHFEMNPYEIILRVKQESLRILQLQGYDIGSDVELLAPDVTINALSTAISRRPELYKAFDAEKRIKYMKDTNFLEIESFRMMQSAIYGKTGAFQSANIDFNPKNNTQSVPPNKNLIFVYFARTIGDKDTDSKETEFLTKMMLDCGCARGIIITESKLNTAAVAKITGITDNSALFSNTEANIHYIQHFLDEELMYTPSDGVLAGKYELLSPADKEALLAENRLKQSQLIKVDTSNIIIKRLGACNGDLVKIIRKFPIADTLIEEEVLYASVYTLPPEKKKTVKKQ